MKPSRIERRLANQTSDLVTPEELKLHLGLFDDDSLDDVIDNALEGAIDKVSQMIGRPVSGENIICYYDGFGEFMEIPGVPSYNASDVLQTTVEVSYYNQSGELTEVSSGATLDPTSFTVHIDDSLLNTDLSDSHRYPVKIIVLAAHGAGQAGQAAINEAIKILAAAYVKGEDLALASQAAHRILPIPRLLV